MPAAIKRVEMRQMLREARKNIPDSEQQAAAQVVAEQVRALPIFQKSKKIAAYIAHRAELDPAPLLEMAKQLEKQIYLPVMDLRHSGLLCFQAYQPGDELHKNRFSIMEPALNPTTAIEPRDLDLVLVPLLGFDMTGRRLGTGGGYYDQTFNFKLHSDSNQPFLLGLAYELQKVTAIAPEPWDVPLQAVITEQTFYSFIK